jgi:hypothetical protein
MGSISVLGSKSEFDEFLYSVILEEDTGAFLTMLSVLARQNVDPWEEAANYARLPAETAVKELASLIAHDPRHVSEDPAARATATRLLQLLPRKSTTEPAIRKPARPSLLRIFEWLKKTSGI